jgi:predicted nucleotidyltransferase
MGEVTWSELSPAKYEQMVAVLISILHPTARRIDGAGGDGGMDVRLDAPNGLHIWELKSFVGRVDSSRRRQIEKSLDRALRSNPAKWHLVVPIDPTQSELAWFRELTDKAGIPLEWLGLNWLGKQMADHPEIPRYFLENGETEAIRLLKELQLEQAALTSAPGAMQRLHTLAARLNEVDPYYRFDLTIQSGEESVQIYPRFAGADVERPIGGTLHGRFPDTEGGREALKAFTDAIDFGIPTIVSADHVARLELDAPAGLGGVFENIAVSISPSSGEPAPILDCRLVICDMTGRVLVALPMKMSRKSAGIRGFVAEAIDLSGAFSLELTFDPTSAASDMSFAYRTPAGALPLTVLPALQALNDLHSPNTAVLELNGKPAGTLGLTEEQWVPDGYVQMIADLSYVQATTATYFALPETFTTGDVESIQSAARLLRGERVPFRWHRMRLTLQNYDVDAIQDLIGSPESGSIRIQRPTHEVIIAGHTINLGASILHFDSARLEQPNADLDMQAGSELDAVLVAGSSTDGYVELITVAPPGGPRFDNAARRLLADAGRAIRELEPEAQTWLFGSRARGDARAGADWDIAIVVPGGISKRRESRVRDRLYHLQLQSDLNPVWDVKLFSSQEWSHGTNSMRRAVERDGIQL